MTTTIYRAASWSLPAALRDAGLPRGLLSRLVRTCWRGRDIVRVGLVIAELEDGEIAEVVVVRGAITVTRK